MDWQKFLDEGFNGPGRAETVRVRDEVGVHERSFLQGIQKARCHPPQQVPHLIQEGRLRRYHR